jgi:hypothetical protein
MITLNSRRPLGSLALVLRVPRLIFRGELTRAGRPRKVLPEDDQF